MVEFEKCISNFQQFLRLFSQYQSTMNKTLDKSILCYYIYQQIHLPKEAPEDFDLHEFIRKTFYFHAKFIYPFLCGAVRNWTEWGTTISLSSIHLNTYT